MASLEGAQDIRSHGVDWKLMSNFIPHTKKALPQTRIELKTTY